MSKEWIRIDPHVHSKGISGCSHVSCEEIIDEKMNLGYDGVILTNHCQSWYYPQEEHASFMEKVIAEYKAGKAYADKKGFRFYLGIEVTLRQPHYADWLLIGVTEEFLRESPCLYTLTQKELFDYCENWGVVMIQAHPYRQSPCDPAYMHGIEINCSKSDLDKVSLVEEFAAQHKLLVTCGTDYHFIENKFKGGIYIPEACKTSVDIAKHIREIGKTRVFFGDREMQYASPIFKTR